MATKTKINYSGDIEYLQGLLQDPSLSEEEIMEVIKTILNKYAEGQPVDRDNTIGEGQMEALQKDLKAANEIKNLGVEERRKRIRDLIAKIKIAPKKPSELPRAEIVEKPVVEPGVKITPIRPNIPQAQEKKEEPVKVESETPRADLDTARRQGDIVFSSSNPDMQTDTPRVKEEMARRKIPEEGKPEVKSESIPEEIISPQPDVLPEKEEKVEPKTEIKSEAPKVGAFGDTIISSKPFFPTVTGKQEEQKEATTKKYDPYTGEVKQEYRSTELRQRQEQREKNAEKIEEKAERYHTGKVNVGFEAERGVKGFFRRVAGQFVAGGTIQPNETSQPQSLAEKVTGIFRPTLPKQTADQVIKNKSGVIAEQQQTTTVPSAVNLPVIEDRPRETKQPRGVDVKTTIPGTGIIREGVFRRVKNQVLKFFSRGPTAAKVAPGLISKAGILLKRAGPVAFIVSTIGGKLLNGVKNLVGGLLGAFKGQTDNRDVTGELGSLTTRFVNAAMTLGVVLGGSGLIPVIFGIIVIVVPFLTWIGIMGVTGSFKEFAENNSSVGADSLPPIITLTKKGSIPNNVNFSEIPAGGISYSISTDKVATGKITDMVTIITKNGSETKNLAVNESFSGASTSYVLEKNIIKNDSIIVNKVTLTGAVNGKPFTQTASYEIIVGNPPVTAFTCPVMGGTITLGSQTTIGGHCGLNYSLMTVCTPGTKDYWDGNNKAIDVGGTEGQNVYLPALNNQSTIWTYVSDGHDTTQFDNGIMQKYRMFRTTSNGVEYFIQIHHLKDDVNFDPTIQYPAGTVLGHLARFDTGVGSHAHIQVQRAGVWTAADDPTLKFCQ
ncbi:MAG: hypothetical protein Q7S14_03280 [bacterium]|nr:hypothetical protein [bacterium]